MCRPWCRSTWTTAPSARTATSTSALSVIPARCWVPCCKPRAGGSKNDKRQMRQDWMRELTRAEDAALAKLMPVFNSDQSPIHPYRVAYEINEFLTDDTIYIGDGGDVVTISAQAVRPRSPGHWMDPGALGSLGVGTGFSIAAKLAHPAERGAVLLRRRRIRHDRVRYGNRRPVRRAVYRGDRQQLGDEPDPLRPDGEVRTAARQCRQQAGRHGVLPLRQNLGRPGRGSARSLANRPCPAARAAVRAGHGKSAVVNIWVDPNEYAPGTKAQTMYK